MPVDNTIYDRLSDAWWDEDALPAVLRTGVNPPRFAYIERVLTEELALDLAGLKMLDVGCGGGLLAEEFAERGARVTGVDPSTPSLQAARAHAAERGLDIAYHEGVGEALPFPDASFDAVYCCDVLEHVDEVGRTVREIARVLRPGGVFLYDTINRTFRSWLLLIKLGQEWRHTRWAEPDTHDWRHFVKPAELEHELKRAGLEPRDRVGIAPAGPLAAVRAMRARAKGALTYGEMGRRLQLRQSRDQSGIYAGYALKR
ncbi:MAG: 3-demethylubiquinone-9 3-O-methyltransferase [Thermoleophilia bacterium]|nr:3-demethylubiquinone-9 3-O-methyltransferase [Thermoleophilia bacterium]